MNTYLNMISTILAHEFGGIDADPRHIMAWILVPSPRLGSMSRDDFVREIRTALACITMAPERTAKLCREFDL